MERRRGPRAVREVFCLCAFLTVLGKGDVANTGGGALLDVELGWSPKEPRQGEVLRLWVEGPEGVSVRKGRLLSRHVHFFPSAERPGKREALFGIDMRQAPGTYAVRVWVGEEGSAEEREVSASIRILGRAFGEERLTLPDAQVHLDEESLARVRKEREQIASLWSRLTPERLWEGPFEMPVKGSPGSPFGLRRWINGEPRSPHTGMDIKAPEGEPVRAANSGRVALVGDFFFSGKAVFLDHGLGMYTMYFHLSRVEVVEGQEVRKGEVLGRVGMTGRATGPHLHWGVRLGGARVDPASLVETTRAGT